MSRQAIYLDNPHPFVNGADFFRDHSLSLSGRNTYEALNGITKKSILLFTLEITEKGLEWSY